jgi:hypothetical protein
MKRFPRRYAEPYRSYRVMATTEKSGGLGLASGGTEAGTA